MKYFYIISYHFCDVYDYVFSDLKDCGYAKYVNNPTYCFPGNFLKRYVLAFAKSKYPRPIRKIAELVGSPYFLHVWLKGVPKDAKLCFIIPPYWLLSDMKNQILKRYPDARFVCVFSDLAATHKDSAVLLKSHRERVDLIYTYDSGDAERYGLGLRNMPYSDPSRYIDPRYRRDGCFRDGIDTTEYLYDICFVGQDKGRLPELLHICENLTQRGFTCSFHLIRIPKEEQVRIPGITYHKKFMSYKECLDISAKSRCILELRQPNSCGNTLRVPEAIALNRKLLSNNPALQNNAYYMPGNMLSFEKIEEVPDSFLTSACSLYPDSLRERIRPETMLKEIDEALCALE